MIGAQPAQKFEADLLENNSPPGVQFLHCNRIPDPTPKTEEMPLMKKVHAAFYCLSQLSKFTPKNPVVPFLPNSIRVQEDLDTIDRLIEDAEATYNKWQHPDPYIVPWAPGGSKFTRNPEPPSGIEIVYNYGKEENE